MAARRPDGFMAVLIDPDDVFLDRKIFGKEGDAIRYATGEGLSAVEGDVARAEVWSPDGTLIWRKTEAKVADQLTAAWVATNRAGLNWQGRPFSTPQRELPRERCNKATLHYVRRDPAAAF
jgi:hypothetical protein